MMTIECPYAECGQRISIGDEHFGKQAECPSCGQPFVCPAAPPHPQEVQSLHRTSPAPTRPRTSAPAESKQPDREHLHKKGFCDDCGEKLSFFRRLATESVVGPQTTEALCGAYAEKRRVSIWRAERTFSRFLLAHAEDSGFAPYFDTQKSYLGIRWLLCFSEESDKMSAFRLGELEVFDGLRNSTVRHGLQLNWENKVFETKSRQFGAVGGVVGGVMAGAVAAEAADLIGQSKTNFPEEVIPQIRNLPPESSMQLVFDITRNLFRADLPLSEVVCCFSGSYVALNVQGGKAFFVIDPNDENFLPNDVRRHPKR